jgi:hypothetical protein
LELYELLEGDCSWRAIVMHGMDWIVLVCPERESSVDDYFRIYPGKKERASKYCTKLI